ncbi:uncharacterized protein BKA78DRAFT_353227 [Phyllosticta capitalensis]|uniref:uncharacterized protein n=1 Tax=Phyllosticta capitalensis TaxID=121624 RepID=UPI00312E1999
MATSLTRLQLSHRHYTGYNRDSIEPSDDRAPEKSRKYGFHIPEKGRAEGDGAHWLVRSEVKEWEKEEDPCLSLAFVHNQERLQNDDEKRGERRVVLEIGFCGPHRMRKRFQLASIPHQGEGQRLCKSLTQLQTTINVIQQSQCSEPAAGDTTRHD